jgi:hypothetical protein
VIIHAEYVVNNVFLGPWWYLGSYK